MDKPVFTEVNHPGKITKAGYYKVIINGLFYGRYIATFSPWIGGVVVVPCCEWGRRL